MGKRAERPIIAEGSHGTIEYGVCLNGAMPAREFVEGLDEGDRRKIAVLFERLAETGRIFNREQFKKIDDGIWEFKRGPVRVSCFQIGNRWILAHGFIKKQDRWPAGELERAKRIMTEHVQRERGGTA